jgi:transcriptional regulator with XRE-family HTH domain
VDRGLFGRWLDTTMDNKGIQGKELAERLGVSDGAVSKWRGGQSVPSQDKLHPLAEILDVDPLRLMATAGVHGLLESGVIPLPLPKANRRRERAREELRKIRHLDRYEREAMIEAYDRIVRERK